MDRITRKAKICFVFLAIMAIPHSLRAGEATDQLRGTIREFVRILANTPVSELQATGLPEAARKLVFARFDFSEMTRLSLGQHWKRLEKNEQGEFVAAFTQRLLTTYGRTVRSGGETIQFKKEVAVGKNVLVETEILDGGGSTDIDYHLHDIGGQWKVFDVVIGNVSMVQNFKAQFDRVIARSSLKDLLQKIKQFDS